MLRTVLLITLLSLLTNSLVLQAKNHAYLKNFFTVENGLSNNEVTSIIQDNDGFIWIGTRGGLNRYDGYEFKIFNQIPGDTNSLVNPSVEKLFLDSKGNIWIGSKSGGVSKYDPVTGKFQNLVSNYSTQSEILPCNRVLSFFEDRKGRIWMGTWENGVIVYDPVTHTSKQYLDGSMITSLIESGDGRIWAGTGQLQEYIESEDKFVRHETGSCGQMCFDPVRNKIWIASGAGGMKLYDLQSQELKVFKIEDSPENPNATYHAYQSVHLDKEGRIWLGTWGTGFYAFNPEKEKFSRYMIYPDNRHTINKDYDAVLDIFQDNSGNIWLGTNGGGVCMLSSKLNFNAVGYHPVPNKGLSNTRIMSVLEDSKGNFWLGTIGSGLYWSPDKVNYYHIKYNNNIKESFFIIKYLYEDSEGKVWVGTNNNTYFIEFREGKPVLVHAGEKYKVHAFQYQGVSMLDQDGIMFFGALQQGLFVLDKKDNYRPKKRLLKRKANSGNMASDRISYLLKDKKDRIWAGTYNGLHFFSKKDTTLHLAESFFDIKGSFTGNIITCLDCDKNGNIWVGTPNGLNRLVDLGGGRFEVQYFTEKEGLASNFIKGISHDNEGNIWLSTNVGISKLVTLENNRVVNFDETDGVLGKNFTEASVFRGHDGKILFGGTQGLTWFYPSEIVEYRDAPSVTFTGLSVFNKLVNPVEKAKKGDILTKTIGHTKSIELTYKQNNFQLEFSPLDYDARGKNRFQYKLENHDTEWHEIGFRRFVNFNNLKPGEYNLLVKSSNRHNVWNNNPSALAIHISPPFWQTWYALLFYIVLVVGVVSIIRWNAVKQVRLTNSLEMEKLQHKQDQKINEMKLRFFTNLSHEFRTPLTLILAPLKEMLNKKNEYNLSENAYHKIGIAQNNSQRLLKLVNQLLDFRKVESGNSKLQISKTDLKAFIREISHPFEELAKINDIKFSVNNTVNTSDIWLDKEKIETVINNLLSNSFKYCKENGQIELNLYEEEDSILLSVSDNGEGIPLSEIDNVFERFYRIGQNKGYGSSGIGLALAKRFVELHKGSISVISKPNKHTEFTVTLLKGKDHFNSEDIVEKDSRIGFRNSTDTYIKTQISVKSNENKESAGNILVVEDNPEVNAYLVEILSSNYKVITAFNGDEGYKKARESKPDLIVSDIMMPQIDGFEFCSKLRENESTATIPFIFLTAKSDEQFRLLGTQIGADDFISKPFDPNLLLEKVKNILTTREKLQKQYGKSVRLEPSDIEITSVEEVFLEKIIATIERELLNPEFSSDVLAKEMNMSASSLYRRLKALTNSSTAEFIRTIRIKRAAQLLADQNKTITEIAYEVGFNDVKHFRTVFQKQFKSTPSEYRAGLSSDNII